MILKCITIDDEPLALKQMESYIKKTPSLFLEGASSSSIKGLQMVEEMKPDLLFIDINMPELNGIDFVKSMTHSCLVIFTTAHDEYAIEGFKLDAADYLLKPIAYPDFLKAVNKARELYEFKNPQEVTLVEESEYFFVKSDYKQVKIKFSDIKYMEGMREYVKIHLTNDTSIMSLMSMKSLEDYLPKDTFMRVHRSFIVNLSKVTTIERQRIVFDKKTYIPIGEAFKDNFEDFVRKHSING